jgi:hypothetical protein
VQRRGSSVSGGTLGWRSAGRRRAGGCRGGGPETLSLLRALWRVGFFIYVRASRVCSSHSSHDVYSPEVVNGLLVRWSGVFMVVPGSCLARGRCGLCLWCVVVWF